jgi:hypothetical protein
LSQERNALAARFNFTFFSTKAEDGFKIGAGHVESRNVASANL